MARVAVIVSVICTIGSRTWAAPATQPSREAWAIARAEAVATVQPSGPLCGQPVAFNPICPPANQFQSDYNRYTFVQPQLWNPYWGYGYWAANRPNGGWGGGYWGGGYWGGGYWGRWPRWSGYPTPYRSGGYRDGPPVRW